MNSERKKGEPMETLTEILTKWKNKIPPEKMKAVAQRGRKMLISVGPIVLVLLLVVFLMTTVLIKGTVESDSMNTCLKHGDGIIGFRLAYLYKLPERGDVVVCKNPVGEGLLVKRVIGLPGDVIEFVSGRVYINNKEMSEPYARGVTLSEKGQTIFYVPDRCVFLMGDNREYSEDARDWERPYVTLAMIKGKALLKYSTVGSVLRGETKPYISKIS